MYPITRLMQRLTHVAGYVTRTLRGVSYQAPVAMSLDEFKLLRADEIQALDREDTTFERFLGEFSDGAFFAPVKRLSRPSHFFSDAWLRNSQRADFQHVNRHLMVVQALAIKKLRRASIPMFCHSAFRTKAEQDSAFKGGFSKVRWPRASHCQGKAFDLIHSVYGWNLTPGEWQFIAKVVRDVHDRYMKTIPVSERFSLEWGGDWYKFGKPTPKSESDFSVGWDPAHWEIKGWSSQPILELTAGPPLRRTPAAILSPTTIFYDSLIRGL